MYDFLFIIASFIAVAVVLSLHEFAHAFVAYKCGDVTPKLNGRLTINPIAHFDLLGLLMFTFAGFGWAKPVPINPYNFRHYKRGLGFTAVAGVVMNYYGIFVLPGLLAHTALCQSAVGTGQFLSLNAALADVQLFARLLRVQPHSAASA